MNADAFPPRVYLIGAQKAGTTSLAATLDRHPDIAVSDPKEPQFYTRNWDRGWEWYRARFPQELPRLCMDASPGYSLSPLPDPATGRLPHDSRMGSVPERICAARPDARFIYVLRDPVERTISSYWHARRAGHESRHISEAVHARSIYVRGSLYSYQIQRFLEHFDLQAFRFIDFRELVSAPDAVVSGIIDWLELAPGARHELERANESYVFSPLGERLVRSIGGTEVLKRVVSGVRRFAPDPAVAMLKRVLTRRVPDTDPSERARIADLLRDEYARTERVCGIRLGTHRP